MSSEEQIWYCDPQKNDACRKTACYLYGGPCHLTTDPSNAMILYGKPLVGPIWYADSSVQDGETGP